MTEKKRPRIRIRFKYNKETGEIEDFIIDDNAPAATEDYHDQVAEAIAGYLGRRPDIDDAGPIRLPQLEPQVLDTPPEKEAEQEKKKKDEETAQAE